MLLLILFLSAQRIPFLPPSFSLSLTHLEFWVRSHMPVVTSSHSQSSIVILSLSITLLFILYPVCYSLSRPPSFSLSLSFYNASVYSLSSLAILSLPPPLSLSLSPTHTHTPRMPGAAPYAHNGELAFTVKARFSLSFYNASIYSLSSLVILSPPPSFSLLSLTHTHT